MDPKMWYTHANTPRRILFRLQKKKKKGDPVIFNKMSEPGAHYAEWNKPDRERQIMHGITYM